MVSEYSKLLLQSGGRILQVVSTVFWANTASCEYSLMVDIIAIYEYRLVGEYCKL